MYLHTDDILVSPVSANELVDYARLDSDDPTIENMLLSATSLVSSFLKLTLISRTWTLKYKNWPTSGTNTRSYLSKSMLRYNQCIELPNANLIAIDSVKINGELTTEYRQVDAKPVYLEFDSIALTDNDEYALEVVYDAGFGTTASDVPDPIKNAILMVATYLHTKNGVCDSYAAIKNSGASELLAPYAVKAGIAI